MLKQVPQIKQLQLGLTSQILRRRSPWAHASAGDLGPGHIGHLAPRGSLLLVSELAFLFLETFAGSNAKVCFRAGPAHFPQTREPSDMGPHQRDLACARRIPGADHYLGAATTPFTPFRSVS
jgi:hypothetical protein